jgi:trehalose-6-phosphate synthase
MIEKAVKDKNDRACNSYRGIIDVRSIKIGIDTGFMTSIALCKACRILIHKRLHKEDLDNVNA